uniref:uncharacterized protein LOC122607764 n=1 Tax=Erigeron canadensis TaxID=72917 RepID=UPI001CB89700|nr:uncharacterized protein LOC122607764 [Erigeron canadensis]
MTGVYRDENKQIGCMSGLLQIFDRQQMLAGKHVHSSKRLPPPTGVGESSSESQTDSSQSSPSTNANSRRPTSKSPVFELKPGAQKFARHSLDSKTTSDSNGSIFQKNICSESVNSTNTFIDDGDDKERLRAPSVIARLMGLESLSSPDQNKLVKPDLQRSASESRVSKYIDDNNFQLKKPGTNNQIQKQTIQNIVANEVSSRVRSNVDTLKKNLKTECSKTPPWRSPRSSFDTTDFFPATNMAMQVDFEKATRMDEHSNDLGTLKQILQVLQLKGLLHNTPLKNDTQHNIVYDESSIVVMKPWRVQSSKIDASKRYGNGRGSVIRGSRSSSLPTRIESNLKSCNSIVKRKPLSIEIQRRTIDSLKSSPTNSPNVTPKRPNKSPRNHNSPKQILSTKNVVTNDKPNINNTTPPSATFKSPKWDGCIQGKSLLQRCDKLLHNIAEMNKNSLTESSPPVLPSPVSVLDSGFDKDELASPLHNIEFKAMSTDDFDESLSLSISPTKLTEHEEFISDDSDFIYISAILGASKNLNEDSSIFFLIEKQLYNTSSTSNVSKRHRKLVFDIIVEMLDRNSELPPWKASMSSIKHIWSEFLKIRETNIKASDVLVDLINGVLRRDLIEISEWVDHPIETSEAVLDVERMIFKDLVCEAITDVDEFSGKCRFLRSQRKLVF